MMRSSDLQESHRDLIMAQFDSKVLENFKDMERPHKPIKVSGKYTIYNFVEECHKFKTKKFELKGEDGFHVCTDNCHIISINAKNNPIEKAPTETTRGGRRKGGRRGSHH